VNLNLPVEKPGAARDNQTIRGQTADGRRPHRASQATVIEMPKDTWNATPA
jgi:hypothetical protein